MGTYREELLSRANQLRRSSWEHGPIERPSQPPPYRTPLSWDDRAEERTIVQPSLPSEHAPHPTVQERVHPAVEVAHAWNKVLRELGPPARSQRVDPVRFREEIARRLLIAGQASHVNDRAFSLTYEGVLWVLPYPGIPLRPPVERYYPNCDGVVVTHVARAAAIDSSANVRDPTAVSARDIHTGEAS